MFPIHGSFSLEPIPIPAAKRVLEQTRIPFREQLSFGDLAQKAENGPVGSKGQWQSIITFIQAGINA